MSDVNGQPDIEEADFEETEAAPEEAAPTPAAKTEGSRQLMAMQAGREVRAIIPADVSEAFRLAQLVHVARLAPVGMESPEKVLVAILHGAEIGLPPMQALQGIAVINGRPSIYGSVAMGLVRKSGVFAVFREWFTGKEPDDDWTAHCLVRRHDEEEEQEFTFSVADAKRAKLWGKKTRNGGDTPWVTRPDRMLKARARGDAFRDKAADVLHGLYLAEEAQDFEPINDVPLIREGSGLAARLPGPQRTGFDPDHIEREVNGENSTKANLAASLDKDMGASVPSDRKDAPEVADFIGTLSSLLKSAKTELEVGAIRNQAAAQIEALPQEVAEEVATMIDHRIATLNKAKRRK